MDEVKSETKQVQNDYLEILNDILEKLSEKGKFQGIDAKKNVSIYVGSQARYKTDGDGEVSVDLMDAELANKIKTAIEDPQNLKGSVRIMIGKDKVYHAKDGEVLVDKLGLSEKINQNQSENQNQAKDVEESVVKQPDELEKPAESVKPSSSIDDLVKQIEDLQQKVREQQSIIDGFSNQEKANIETTQKLAQEIGNLKKNFDAQQQTIDKLQKSLQEINNRNSLSINTEAVGKWINSIENKVKDTAKNVYQQVKTALTPKADKVKSQLEAQITTLKEEMNKQIESLKGEMSSQVEAIKNEFESQVGVVKEGINEFKQILKDEVNQGIERHQEATGAIQGKILEEVNTVQKQVTKAVADIKSATNHTVKENIEKVTNTVVEAQSKALSKSVGAMIRVFGKQNPDGSRTYESKNYNFSQKENSVTVTAKDGRPVIVDNKLADKATSEDIKSLEEVADVVSNYLGDQSQSRSQMQSKSIKR